MPHSIENLKKMNLKGLEKECQTIREDLIENIKETGGHLASNLGMVELTVALHYVFDSPRDVIFFDVSHQCYTHKMLTSRANEFKYLRKYHGLSGFSSPSESIHDPYEAGHSSTSISYALGYLEAKEKDPNLYGNIISVIGDASIVNGLAMEALNYLGSKPNQKMIIILNDNEMGISKNTGGLARTFNNIRAKGRFKILRKITPRFIKNALKSVAYKNNIFTGFGLKYLGIIDGHNLKDLIKYLEYAKKSPTSIVLHVKTTKGKGFKFAEEDKTGVWHSVPPFNPVTGAFLDDQKEEYSFGISLSKKLIEEIKNDDTIKVITPGMAYGSGIDEILSLYPKNFIDVGIAEENAITLAASLATNNFKPVVFLYSTFLSRAYDELLIDVARLKKHVVICLDRSGIVSGDGPTHQGIFDVAYLSSIPYLSIMAPRNTMEATKLLEFALESEGTFVIRYPKDAVTIESSLKVEKGKWEILKNSNNQKYIISYGPNLDLLREKLKNKDIGLINACFIKPFDQDLILKLVKEENTLYFYEEVVANNSLGSQVLTFLNNAYINKEIPMYKIHIKTLPNSYLEIGSRNELVKSYNLEIDEFIKKVGED